MGDTDCGGNWVLFWWAGPCLVKLESNFLLMGGIVFLRILNIHPCAYNAAAAKSLQSCPTLCDPMDCSLPGSSIHGIFQARVLRWVAISFSSGSSWPRDQTQIIAGREHSYTHQQKIGLKIYWAWSIRTRPSFPLCQSLPSGSFYKPLILADSLKTTITEN